MNIYGILLICCCILIPCLEPGLKMSRWLILAFCIATPFLAYCDVPIGQTHLEWQPYNPDLHGKTFRFTRPMAYVILNNNGNYSEQCFKIGRTITDQKDVSDNSIYYEKYEIENIEPSTNFTVMASFISRSDLISNMFGKDVHFVLVKDEKGVSSFMYFFSFADTNKQQLKKME